MAKPSEDTGVERWVLRTMRPWAFFAGVALGFLACCLASWVLSERNCFKNFQRFHDYINATSCYYPTALQVRALVYDKIPGDKIAVIIGGDSILQGSGQGSKQLWSEQLQRDLGERYCVLNLAMPSGGPNEFGMLAAEMLRARGQKVIYLCDCSIARFCVEADHTSSRYRYLFYDAQAHGLLSHFAERDQALAELGRQETSDSYADLRWRSQANALLGFNDLWHIVGYRLGFTVWSARVQGSGFSVFGPRRRCRETEMLHPDPDIEKRNRNHYESNLAALRFPAKQFDDTVWTAFEAKVKASLSPDLRARSIVVTTRLNPYYAEHFEKESPGSTERVLQNITTTLDHVRACGVSAFEGCKTMEANDYWDVVHLTPEGGGKLATELAPVVRSLASELGYLEE